MGEAAHPVVTLLISRMQSHPEEFSSVRSRWSYVIDQLRDTCPYEQMKELEAVLANIVMDGLHQRVMNMLLNGDQTEQDTSAQKATVASQLLLQSQKMQAAQLAQHQTQTALAQQHLQNTYSQTATATGLYNPTSSTLAGTFPSNLAMGLGVGTTSPTSKISPSIQVGDELHITSEGELRWRGGTKLTKRMVRRMKEMLGL